MSKNTPLLTSCVFLPDETAPGYGKHVPHDQDPGLGCNCVHLYGEEKPWGCYWYTMWQKQTLRAAAKCNLLVVTKMDGSLGNSQQGEVRFLEAEKKPYKRLTIKEFAELLLAPEAPPDVQPEP